MQDNIAIMRQFLSGTELTPEEASVLKNLIDRRTVHRPPEGITANGKSTGVPFPVRVRPKAKSP